MLKITNLNPDRNRFLFIKILLHLEKILLTEDRLIIITFFSPID